MDRCQEKMALHLYWHLRLLLCLHESESCCYRNTSISRSANASSSSALHGARFPSPSATAATAKGRWRQAFVAMTDFFFFSCCPFLCSRWPPVVHKPTCHRIFRTFCVPDTLAWHLMFVFDSVWRAAQRVFLPSQWLDLMFTLLLVSCPAILGWGLPMWIHPSRSSTERCKLWTMKLHTSLDLALCWCLFSHREICWYWCLSFFTPFYPNFHRVICGKAKHVWNDKPGAEEGSFKASKITRMYLNRSINKEKRRKRQRNSFFYTPLFWQTHKKVNIF